MTTAQNESLIVCMPVYDKIHPLAWEADMKLTAALAREFPAGQLAFLTQRRLTYPYAFNAMCKRAMDGRAKDGKPFDWMLWIEDDTLPPPDAFRVLREQADPVKRPIMHALSFDRNGDYDPSLWQGGRVEGDDDGIYIQPIRDWEPNKLYRIIHSGTCCVLFHMSIWDKLERPWFRMQPPDDVAGVGLMPHVSLSQRIFEAKIPMYGYTGCIVPHIGDEEVIGEAASRLRREQLQVDSNAGIQRFL